MSAPFFQCPRCKSIDVIGLVDDDPERKGRAFFYSRCFQCGLSEQGPLVDVDTPVFACTLFDRWLHPKREKVTMLFERPPEPWTCAACGADQVTNGDPRCHACWICQTKRFLDAVERDN